MFCWKPWLVAAFLPLLVMQLPPQWGLGPSANTDGDLMGGCRNYEIDVRDSWGMAIASAVVITENSVMPFTTNSQGLAAIPCHSFTSRLTMLEIGAPGYHTSRVTMISGNPRRLRVVLDRLDTIKEGSETVVSAEELRRDVQAKSMELQRQASSAVRREDYDAAEKLLIQAHDLTPSLAVIPDNLGVVELHRKDLKEAGRWFEKAMRMAPYNADIVVNLGVVRFMQHREDESYQLLMRAASMGRETDAGNYIMGTASLKRGINKQAVMFLKKVSSEKFSYRDLYLSIALRNLGKNKAADDAYRSFLKRNHVAYALSTPQK